MNMEKVLLPIKTKIAAWGMILFFIVSVFAVFQMIFSTIWEYYLRDLVVPIWFIAAFLIGLSGIFLLKRKKWTLVLGMMFLMFFIFFNTNTRFYAYIWSTLAHPEKYISTEEFKEVLSKIDWPTLIWGLSLIYLPLLYTFDFIIARSQKLLENCYLSW